MARGKEVGLRDKSLEKTLVRVTTEENKSNVSSGSMGQHFLKSLTLKAIFY